MMTNPHFAVVPPMTCLSEIDLINHLIYLDAVCDGKRFTNEEMEQCHSRFKRFAKDQWENRAVKNGGS